jgi:hypothetical protein
LNELRDLKVNWNFKKRGGWTMYCSKCDSFSCNCLLEKYWESKSKQKYVISNVKPLVYELPKHELPGLSFISVKDSIPKKLIASKPLPKIEIPKYEPPIVHRPLPRPMFEPIVMSGPGWGMFRAPIGFIKPC